MYKLELNDNEAIYIDYQIPINNMKLQPGRSINLSL